MRNKFALRVANHQDACDCVKHTPVARTEGEEKPLNRKIQPVAALMMLLVAGSVHAQAFQALPAPPGVPSAVALRVIREAEHPCPKVVRANRAQDQSILAYCSNKETYLVFSIRPSAGAVMDVAMKCSAARALGVKGAC